MSLDNLSSSEQLNFGLQIVRALNGEFKVISVNNYLGNSGDRIRLYKQSVTDPIDDISYGNQGGVCTSSQEGSIGRLFQIGTEGTDFIDRFSSNTRGTSNKDNILDPCPTPTPEPTETQTPSSIPTNTLKPTNTPTLTPSPKPSKTPTPTPISTIRPTSSLKPTGDLNDDSLKNEEVFGLTANGVDSGLVVGIKEIGKEASVSSEQVERKNKIPAFAIVLVVLGIGLIGLAVFSFLRKERYNIKNDKDNL